MLRTSHLSDLEFRCSLLVVLSLGAIASAESQEASPRQSASDPRVIEEIVVTAQKRETPAQDVPVSMTVFSGTELEALHLNNIAGVARYTPNVEWDTTFVGASNSSAIFIRGIGQENNFASSSTDPGVGVYLDGVYIGRGVGSALTVLDVNQVEVLRGPQGTLFGKNTVGGAVTIASTRPAENLSGWADATTGSDNRGDLRFAVNVPITDRVRTRFSVASQNQDGYGKSLQDGTEFGDINTDSGRATLRWLPADQLTIDFIVDWTRTRENSPNGTLVYADADPLSLTGAYNFFVAPSNTVDGFGDGVPWDSRFVTPGRFTSYATGESGSDLDTRGVTAIVDWRTGGLTFASITAYRDLDVDWSMDVDLSPLTIVEDIIGLSQHQFSQEFNLQGNYGLLDWLAGVYYFDETATALGGVLIVPEVATVEFDPVFGVPNPLFGIPLSSPPRYESGELQRINDHHARSVAAYTHLNYSFSDRWSGFAGIRYTSEEKRVSNSSAAALVASDGSTETFTKASPTLGLQYFLNDGVQVYGSVSQGFKSGGFNTIVVVPREDYLPYNPAEVTSYELGVKAVGERFRVSAAAFFADYTDIQIPVLNGVEPQTLNAAEAEITGAELELVAALLEGLKLQAGVGYLDAKYTRLYEDGLAGLVIPVTLDSKLMNARRWSVNLNLIYTAELRALGQLILRGDYSWRDRAYKDSINTEEIAQEDHGILHASATLVSANRHWEFTLFGDNLTDETYVLSGTANKPDFGLVFANYARPLTWGFRVQYRFGAEGG